MPSEIHRQVSFSQIRYAQCWEDADVLLEALDVQPGCTYLSIASAGDNTLALLGRSPARVIAVDFSFAQIACLELRVAAYRVLSHTQMLEMLGSRPINEPQQRIEFYRCCRSHLTPAVQEFWDRRSREIQQGIGSIGKFERYLALFRRYCLPLIHSPSKIEILLKGGPSAQRSQFYETYWDTWRWRWLFRGFFSRFVMGRLGRDPQFFRYGQGTLAEYLLQRTRDVVTLLDPADNPYLQWIGIGHHNTALPYALRPENFETIRANLDRLEWYELSLEDFLARTQASGQQGWIDGFNLSDIFEWMSFASYQQLLGKILISSRPAARLVYWNLLADRQRPENMADRLKPLTSLATQLHQQDKVWFYRRLVVEEAITHNMVYGL